VQTISNPEWAALKLDHLGRRKRKRKNPWTPTDSRLNRLRRRPSAASTVQRLARGIGEGRRGQGQAARAPQEKCRAHARFECAHMPADGSDRDVQVIGRACNREVSRSRRERPHGL